MFDGLSRRDETGIERWRSLELLDDLFAFGDDALDGFAGLAACRLAEKLEHLFKALDLSLSFFAMLQEAFFPLLRLRSTRHFRQRLQDLLFCKVNVFQRVQKQVVECLGVCHVLLHRF
ncbi:hypothetical protein D3C80_1580980 [compost metagenome]